MKMQFEWGVDDFLNGKNKPTIEQFDRRTKEELQERVNGWEFAEKVWYIIQALHYKEQTRDQK